MTSAKESNLIVDLAMGPNQGAGVPAPYDDEGLLWDLNPFNITVAIGGSFDGVLPGWGSGPLVAAVTGEALNPVVSSARTRVVLKNSSLTDVTSQVDGNGRLSIQFPADSTAAENVIFAYYLQHTRYREVQSPAEVAAAVPQSPVTDWRQNGSWAVDHFSKRGAQTVIDFWESELLDANIKELISQVGNYMWEDSMEMDATIWWTPTLPSAFESGRGYSLVRYIPILISSTSSVSNLSFATDEPDAGASHIVDYRQTVSLLSMNHLTIANHLSSPNCIKNTLVP